MNYEVLVLDLDGTLTNSEKKITEPTKEALLDIQQKGKIVVLASAGRPPHLAACPRIGIRKIWGICSFF
mgnify:CR=1 FL=1